MTTLIAGPHDPAGLGFDMPEVAGIFVGGCIERGVGSSFRARAHAHNNPGRDFPGWVCVRSARRVVTSNGKPTRLMMHEYAHILTPKVGHTAAWRETMKRLGQPLPKRYQPRTRGNVAARGVTTHYHTTAAGKTHGPFDSRAALLAHMAACE